MQLDANVASHTIAEFVWLCDHMRCFVYLCVHKGACVPDSVCVCACVSMCLRCVCRETACVNRRYSWAGLIVLVIAVVSSLLPGLIAPYATRRTPAENWSTMVRGDGFGAPGGGGGALGAFWPWVRLALHSTFVVVLSSVMSHEGEYCRSFSMWQSCIVGERSGRQHARRSLGRSSEL